MDVVNSYIGSVAERRGISIRSLAGRTGLAYPALLEAINGHRYIRAEELFLLCNELEIDLNDISKLVLEKHHKEPVDA